MTCHSISVTRCDQKLNLFGFIINKTENFFPDCKWFNLQQLIFILSISLLSRSPEQYC